MKNGALNKRVLWLAASLLMMVAIALSATGEKEVEEGRLELVTAEAELGNERFNWILQTGTGVRVMISPYLETLLTLEEQGKPGLAERSEVSDDGLTWEKEAEPVLKEVSCEYILQYLNMSLKIFYLFPPYIHFYFLRLNQDECTSISYQQINNRI